jgi:hypothetical protein
MIKRAELDRTVQFNNLYSALNYGLLYEAFCRLKRGKAPGVDGVTLEDFGQNVIANLRSLEARLHRQSYRPQPSLRREIPNGNGKTRLSIRLEAEVVSRLRKSWVGSIRRAGQMVQPDSSVETCNI